MTDRSVLVRLKADPSDFNKAMVSARAAVGDLRDGIDTTNDRTAWLAQGILALAPAVAPLGAAAVPAIAGLATQMTVAGLAAGTAVLAFQGLGDGLSALNDYQLEPTAANMEKLNEAMAKVGPDGEKFVRFLDSVAPQFAVLSDTARAGMFPGMTEGIESFMDVLPRVNTVVRELAEGMGQLGADAGAGLSGARFEKFFTYLETDAKPILVEMGHALGNLIDGFASMMVAFGPLTADFSAGLENMTRSFADWAHSLEGSQGFGAFVDYVRQSVPIVLDFLGSFATAFIEIAEAAAPVGDVMLPILTRLFDVIGQLADTPLGPMFLAAGAAVSVYGRAVALAQITTGGLLKQTATFDRGVIASGKAAKASVPSFREFGTTAKFAMFSTDALTKSSWSYSQAANKSAFEALKARQAVKDFAREAAPAAAGIGLLALSATGVSDKMGLTNTTSLALMGTLVGPWGAAVGAGAGLLLDMKAGADEATKGIQGLSDAIDSGSIDELAQRLAETKAEFADQDKVTGFGDFFSDAMRDIGASGDESALETYAKAIEEAEQELADLKNARADTAADSTFYNMLQAETAALEDNIAAMRAKRDELLRAENAELGYRGAILDARDALKENGRTLDRNTRAGLENRGVLINLASTWNAQSDAVKSSSGAHRDAIKNFVAVAEQMGMNREQARRYAESLFEIPPNRDTKISLDISTAAQKVAAIKAELASIKDEDVFVNVRKVNASGFGPQATSSAGGGSVPKSGQPYADRYPYLLADGEEVITNDPRRNSPADTYRPVLKAINADMPRHVIKGMLADGGTASGKKRKPLRLGADDSMDSTDRMNKMLGLMLQQAQAAERAAQAQENAAQIALTAAEDQQKAAEEQLSAAEQARDNTQALYDSLNESVSSQFSDPITGGGLSGLMSTLSTGINAGSSMTATLQALAAAGLDTTGASGGLFRELAASEDLTTANQLLAAGPEMIAQLEAQYAERDSINQARGEYAADQSYGVLLDMQAWNVGVYEGYAARAEATATQMQFQLEQANAQIQVLTGAVRDQASQLAEAMNSVVRPGRR